MAQHKMAKISDIPEGQGKTFTVEGQEVAVFNKGGQFFAIDNTCIHKGGSLGEGSRATSPRCGSLLPIGIGLPQGEMLARGCAGL